MQLDYAFSRVARVVPLRGCRWHSNGSMDEDRGNKLTGAKLIVGIDSRSIAVGLARVQSVPAGVLRGSLPVDRGCGLLFLWPGRMRQFIRFGEFLRWSLMNYMEMSLWWRPLPYCNFGYWSYLIKICETYLQCCVWSWHGILWWNPCYHI